MRNDNDAIDRKLWISLKSEEPMYLEGYMIPVLLVASTSFLFMPRENRWQEIFGDKALKKKRGHGCADNKCYIYKCGHYIQLIKKWK